jgi:hypothetical protein
MTILESRVRTLTTTEHLSNLTTLSSGTLSCSITASAVSVGLAWSASASISSARYHVSGSGSQNAAFVANGITSTAPSPTGAQSPMSLLTVEAFNGTNWFSRADTLARRFQGASFGNYAGTIVVGGENYAIGVVTINGVATNYEITLSQSEIHTIILNSWRSSSNLNTDRRLLSACGTVNAGLTVAGYRINSVSNVTEKFNGLVWSNSGAVTARYGSASTGSQNAALCFGGFTTGVLSITEKFNGNTWSSTGSMPTALHAHSGAGSGNYALSISGYTTVGTTVCQRFNVSTWSTSQSNITARWWTGGAGTQNKALVFGGSSTTISEKYNGNALLQIKVYSRHEEDNSNQSTSIKVLEEAHIEITNFPYANLLERTELQEISLSEDDGCWSSSSGAMTVARQGCMATGTYRTALIFGGFTSLGVTVPVSSIVTEKFNLDVVTASANMLLGTWNMGCSGTQNATFSFGGNASQSPFIRNNSYSFNGTSWSSSSATLNVSRQSLAGLGASLSAFAIGGSSGTEIFRSTEIYNGTSWSNSQNLNIPREAAEGTGSVNSAIIVNGRFELSGNRTRSTEKFNGVSWSSSDMPVVSFASGGISGTQNNCVFFGGFSTSVTSLTQVYNGTTWFLTGAMVSGRHQHGGCGTQSYAIATGGFTTAIANSIERRLDRFAPTVTGTLSLNNLTSGTIS